ncbi:MAG: hypothetical protein CL927_06995 [Deltaproteobacteria bacterium]|nr:hypothetical protein [Deltaproteobacteria bacterium]
MARMFWLCGMVFGVVGCVSGADPKAQKADAGTTATNDLRDDTGSSDSNNEPLFDAVDELERLLIGFYDSSEQATTSRDYYNIMLTMCPVSLPGLGERVLYVEQASADTPRQPYRQRLYAIVPGATESQAISRVYELAGPGSFVGACEDAENFAVDMDRVLLLEGCDVTLDWDGTQFVGGTDGDSCGTDFGGATYATSEIVLDEDILVSWDRGYDASGRQVWGATGGGYQFIRHTDLGAW